MKKNCLFVILLVLLCFSANAEDENSGGHLLSFGFSLGLVSGTSEEIVYRSSSTDAYMSQLIWPLSPLFYMGIDVGYSWQDPLNSRSVFRRIFSGFFIDASVKLGLPGDSGQMEDRDWIGQPTWAVSHYSVHDNRAETAVLTGLEAGKSFRLYNEFRLSVFLSYNVMYYSFTARGGTFLYPDIYGGHFYNPGSEAVVTYRQFWQVFSPGVSFYGVFNRFFDIDIFIKITPLVTASSFDEHLTREPPMQIINDPMYYGLFIEPGLVFSFKPTASNFLLSFSLNYRSIHGTRGNSRYRYPDRSVISPNAGGVEYSTFDIGITAKFRIRK